jgi:adenylate kinase
MKRLLTIINWNRFYAALLRLTLSTWRRIFGSMILVMLGGPGAGKGTVSKRLAPALKAVHLSTGDELRAEMEKGTPLGQKAKAFVDAGRLVPDAIIIQLILDRLDRWKYRNGVILDGAIRTLVQAKALDAALKARGMSVTRAVQLDPADEVIYERLAKRMTCSNTNCGRTYHLTMKPPKVPGVCDACQSPLYQRKDDVPEVIAERLSTYRREVTPICEHYGQKLTVVKPTESTTEQEVFDEVINALRAERISYD